MAGTVEALGLERLRVAAAQFGDQQHWIEAWDQRDWAQGKIGWLPQWRDALAQQVGQSAPSRLDALAQGSAAIDDYLTSPTAVRLLIADNRVGHKLAVASVRCDGQGARGDHQLLHVAAFGQGTGAGTVLVGEVMREAGRAGCGLRVRVAPGMHGYFVGRLGLQHGGTGARASAEQCAAVAAVMGALMHPDAARRRYVDFISGIGEGPWDHQHSGL
ncbi:MAG: hypothetical protein ACYDGR_09830 [Candidatus Dormibacteria bacterium]